MSIHLMRCLIRSIQRPSVRYQGFLSKRGPIRMGDKSKISLYDILGLHKNASTKQIKASYYELAKMYHPDANIGNAEANKKFQEITEAYEVLTDDHKRAEYDKYGTISGATTLKLRILNTVMERSDYILKNVFKPFTIRQTLTDIEQQPDQFLEKDVPITITFEESINGGKRELMVPVKVRCEKCKEKGIFAANNPDPCKMCGGSGIHTIRSESSEMQVPCKFCGGSRVQFRVPCPECNGKGKIFQNKKVSFHIPKLVEDGDTLDVRHPARRKPIRVIFKVDNSAKYVRNGNDVITIVDLPLSKAILGGKMNIKGLNGFMEVIIAPGTQNDSVQRLFGRGIKIPGTEKFGDQILKFHVKIPNRLNEKQRSLIKQLEQIEETLDAANKENSRSSYVQTTERINTKDLFPKFKY